MKYILSLAVFLCIFVGSSVSAQSSLKEQIPLGAGKTLSGNFVQNRFLTGFEAPFKTNGEFFLVPNSGLAWIVFEPFPSRLLMTGDGITQITHGVPVKVGNAEIAKSIAKMMYPALSGDWQQVSPVFDVSQQPAPTGEASWQVTLDPVNDRLRQFIRKIVVTGGQRTRTLIIYKRGGDRDEITFSDQKIWDKPPVNAIAAFDTTGSK